MSENTYKCPHCNGSDDLFVVVLAWAKLNQEDDGNLQTEPDHDDCPDHDHEWSGTSLMRCTGCGQVGPAQEFRNEAQH